MMESNCESSLMIAYCQKVRKLEDKFHVIELNHVSWKDNNDANALAKMAAQRDPASNRVFVNDFHEPLIRVKPDPPQGSSDLVPGDLVWYLLTRHPLTKGSGGPIASWWRPQPQRTPRR
jgi:hypothetical protein